MEQIRKETEDSLWVYPIYRGIPQSHFFTQKSAFFQLIVCALVNLLHSFVCIGSKSAHSCGSACLQREAAMRDDARHTLLAAPHITLCSEKIALSAEV